MNAPITETAVNPTSGADSDLPALFADSDVRAWYRRPVLWTGALLLVIAGAGGWYWQAHRAASTGPSYTTRTVVRGDRGGAGFSDTGISNGMDAPAWRGIKCAKVEVSSDHLNQQERPR